MKKKYFLILFFIIILLISIIIFYSLQSKKVYLESPSGIIKIVDPETNKNFENINGTFYYNKNQNYFFTYDKKTNRFSIIISSPDIQVARENAEKKFIKILEIKKEDACKLTIDLRPLGGIIDMFKLQDINYGLSFCPNSTAFPK
jgi:hypothetical protein